MNGKSLGGYQNLLDDNTGDCRNRLKRFLDLLLLHKFNFFTDTLSCCAFLRTFHGTAQVLICTCGTHCDLGKHTGLVADKQTTHRDTRGMCVGGGRGVNFKLSSTRPSCDEV